MKKYKLGYLVSYWRSNNSDLLPVQNDIKQSIKQNDAEQLMRIVKMIKPNYVTKRLLTCIFEDCLENDNTLCLESFLCFVAEREWISVADTVTLYNLPYLSMTKNKVCFEYLISITKHINKYIYVPMHAGFEQTTLLREACEIGDPLVVKLLIKHGANVNMNHDAHFFTSGNTLLHTAVQLYNRIDDESFECIIQHLLLAGVDACAKNSGGLMVGEGLFLSSGIRAISKTTRSFAENCF